MNKAAMGAVLGFVMLLSLEVVIMACTLGLFLGYAFTPIGFLAIVGGSILSAICFGWLIYLFLKGP